MHEDRYFDIVNTPDYDFFTFTSTGRHGKIVKVVRFEEMIWLENTFNLALGTMLPNGEEDFESLTNNGDRNKILGTVAYIIFLFFDKHPDKDVYLIGSDDRRTMLYQRAISYGYDKLTQSLIVCGEVPIDAEMTNFVPFDKNDNYVGFLIKRK